MTTSNIIEVCGAEVATLLAKYTFIGVTSITLGVLAFGVITGILA